MTLGIMRFNITALNITTCSIGIFSIATFGLATFSIKGLFVTLGINDAQLKNTLRYAVIMLGVTFYLLSC
jgi:hypothetical protein